MSLVDYRKQLETVNFLLSKPSSDWTDKEKEEFGNHKFLRTKSAWLMHQISILQESSGSLLSSLEEILKKEAQVKIPYPIDIYPKECRKEFKKWKRNNIELLEKRDLLVKFAKDLEKSEYLCQIRSLPFRAQKRFAINLCKSLSKDKVKKEKEVISLISDEEQVENRKPSLLDLASAALAAEIK